MKIPFLALIALLLATVSCAPVPNSFVGVESLPKSSPARALRQIAPQQTVEGRAARFQANPSLMTDRTILINLSHTSSLKEKAILYAAMQHLPSYARRNVIYFSRDNHVYATSRFLRNGASITPSINPRPDAAFDLGPPYSNYFGGFYHVRPSDKGAGFGYITYKTNIPCTTTNIANSAVEDAYAQTGGGFGINGNSTPVAVADMGLQYSAEAPPLNQKFSVQSYGKIYPGTAIYQGANHWYCDQTGFLIQYWVDSLGGNLVLYDQGNSVENPLGTSETVMVPENYSGWSGDCLNTGYYCWVKRDTAFAKNENSYTFPDGSYFAVANHGTGSAAAKLYWTNVQRGYWNGAPFDVTNWSEDAWTNCPSGTPNVLYQSTDASDEVTGLDMSTGSSTSSCLPVDGSGLSDY